jgi:zinc transport system permease protein
MDLLNDFFIRALLAGLGICLIAGPLGCFVVWRRMAYFGDTLAHAALLGVSFGLILQIPITAAVFAMGTLIALSLLFLLQASKLSADAILGLLSHASLALGLVTLSFASWLQVDLTSLLFGDILSVSKQDLVILYISTGAMLVILALIWNRLFASTVSPDIAKAEGLKPLQVDAVFLILLAGMIALSIQFVGILLISALLIIPAATARKWASTPESMAVWASLLGMIAVISGLELSAWLDTPSGPSIVVSAFGLFLATMLIFSFVSVWVRRRA